MAPGRLAVLALALLGAGDAAAVTVTRPSVTVASPQVTFGWSSDVAASTEVYFGASSSPSYSGYAFSSVSAAASGTRHGRTLPSVAPGVYYFRVRSADATGGSAQSDEGTFVVPPPDLLNDVQVQPGVLALTVAQNAVYLGGDFHQAGPRLGHLLSVDGTSAVPARGVPDVAGEVRVITPDGVGGFYIAGTFGFVGGVPRHGLAHLLPDLGLDPFWAPRPDGPVDAIAVLSATVYLGGTFQNVNGSPRAHLAAVDAVGALLPFDSGCGSPVSALAAVGSTLYVGGSFLTIGGASRSYLAALDAATGAALPWSPDPDSFVSTFCIAPPELYVGGLFTTIGGATRGRGASFDLATGALEAWDPGTNNDIEAIAVAGPAVYIGGSFDTVGGVAKGRAAAVDPATGAPLPWDSRLSNDVYSIAVAGSTVYLGGIFQDLTGFTPRTAVAAFDLTGGALLPWDPALNSNTVRALAVSGGSVIIGGNFTSASGVSRLNAASLELTAFALTPWSPAPDQQVWTLASDGARVYLGGAFTQLGSTTRRGAAAVDPTSGAVLPWNPDVSGSVLSIWPASEGIYLGGSLTAVNGSVARSFVALVDADGGAVLPWNAHPDDFVWAVASAPDGTVYVGGYFSTVDGGAVSRTRVAAFDATGAVTPWAPQLTGSISSLQVGSELYVGGSCIAGDGGCLSVAAIGFDGGVSFVTGQGYVYGIQRVGSRLYVGGQGVRTFDAVTGAPGDWQPAINGTVRGIAVGCPGGPMVVGGEFDVVGGVSQAGVAIFAPAFACGPSAPTVTTYPATFLDGGVTLNGAVSPSLRPTTFGFRLGSAASATCDDSFGAPVPAGGGIALDAAAGSTAESVELGPLAPGTWFFCALAHSDAGLGAGAVLSFTLAPGAPEPDGGPKGQHHFTSGCGCASAGAPAAMLLAVVLRRRRRAPRLPG